MEDRLPVDQRNRALTATPATADGLHSFAAASPDLACITDVDGTITSTNPAWGAVLGWSRSDLVDHPFLDLVHEDDLDRTRGALDRVLAGEPVLDLTARWATADHRWRWISWSMTLGPGQHVYGSGRDVTARVRHQLDTARSADELRAALAEERAAADQLRERALHKDTYLSAVSHELRTPVMLAHGAAETLAQHRHELPSDEIDELETLIVTQTQRLTRVLTELLDVDRIGHGEPSASRRDLELVGLVGSAIDASPSHQRITLVAPDEVHLSADPAQVEHIVTNLLENADKYAPDGEVCVTVDADRDVVRIGVRDQGPGIASSALERVFEPFWRAEPQAAQPGTGVGLALVAEFARLHGGRAWAEPVHHGAHVIVELPTGVPA